MLMFHFAGIYKEHCLNRIIFETYRSSTGDPSIDPLNELSKDQLEKEQF